MASKKKSKLPIKIPTKVVRMTREGIPDKAQHRAKLLPS